MSRELAEVRRYWPRAKRSKSGARFWAVGERVHLTLVADVWEVGGVSDAPLPSLKHIGATIAEAMRAAGFGRRQLGKHAREQVKRSEYRKQLMGHAALGPSWSAGAARLLAYYQPRMADRQRPSKGARLGRRKRRRYDIGEPWYGLFPGGDPRLFTPDPEWCTPDEIARHAASCEDWNRGKRHDRGPSCLTNGDGSAWRGDGFGLGMVWWSWKDKRRGGVK